MMLRLRPRLLLPLALAGLCACDIGSACDEDPLTPAGDLDRIGDAVLVVQPEDDTGRRSFVVISNPEIQQLRVYDVLERSFVRAPNVFFPLSLHTGPSTRRLAVAAGDGSFVFALDSADDTLSAVRIAPLIESEVGENGEVLPPAPDFRVAAIFSTGRAPGDVAIVRTAQEWLAFIALPDEGALQVLALDTDAGTATERARIALGEGSHPARVAADPSGDAVLVTDARLSSVAIIRVDDLTLDRRIEVGGPTAALAIGRVDPGDGLGPVALVARRDQPELAAIRLFRPGFREERYALLARLETRDIASSVFVNDAALEGAVACCALRFADQLEPDDATFAWGAYSATNGFFTYLRFDGARGPYWDGTQLVERSPAARGVLRPVDLETPHARVLEEVWAPAEDNDPQPSIEVTDLDNYGTPPTWPLFDLDLSATVTYEGTPAGARGRRADGPFTDGDRYRVEVVNDGVAFADRDVRDGDVISVDTAAVGGSCPERVVTPISGLSGNRFFLAEISDTQAACMSQSGEFRFTLFAASDFTVSLSAGGYRGRVPLSDVGQRVELPGFLLTITANAAPGRGSHVKLALSQGVIPLDLDLARPPDFTVDGFGRSALLTTSIVSGSVDVRDFSTTAGGVFRSNRMFISTGAGALLEMEEGEVLVDRIAQHR